ncbi:bifunctional transcriptional activator/DNA repair enzyme Ada isoform X2 [Harmonia axyridis]|uniref:bifunctional transcriptional activator/DNA repair enzyme Ada isoform X2 n=1 Tax=Harmonia axyridis TaxID=115357 RepID=UPI001E2751D1|nr:bifunctional transcriptional activator/DNA repair enzyme Ada isoform X2 [Harmonia axyridis]
MVRINIVEDCRDSRNLIYGSDGNIKSEILNIKTYWPAANFSEDNVKIDRMIKNIFDKHNSHELNLKLTGTEFQVSVWKALINIGEGSTVCYEDVAKAIGKPKAVRAVASAVKNNKLAYLIPCHRVLSKNGGLNEYKWGVHRKLKLLTYEKK